MTGTERVALSEPKASGAITIAAVAARAGVDRAVVSRVINNDPRLKIRDATRERVLAAIRELDYRPNVAARSLRTAKTGLYGLFIPTFANPIYAEIIAGAEEAARERGSLLFTASSLSTATPSRQDLDWLRQGRMDGLLLAGMRAATELIQQLRGSNMPWVLLNQRANGIERSVILDDELAASIGVSHLIDLGHRRIAHIGGAPGVDTAQRRLAGYRRTMKKENIAYPDEFVVPADYTPAGGAAAMTRLLEGNQRPTAVFVANVASAIGAIYAVSVAGLSVPDDISVVAVHDLPLATHLVPPLTTVRTPLRELGRRGVEILGELEPAEPVEETVQGRMELMARASTAPPRA